VKTKGLTPAEREYIEHLHEIKDLRILDEGAD
jgi:hypothetical protein